MISVLLDLGCTIYSVFNKDLADRLHLPRTKVSPRELRLATNSSDDLKIIVDEICWAEIDIDGKKSYICGYIIERLAHDLILGEPWMRLNDVLYRARDRTLYLEKDEHFVHTRGSVKPHMDISMVKHTELLLISKVFTRRRNKSQTNNVSRFLQHH